MQGSLCVLCKNGSDWEARAPLALPPVRPPWSGRIYFTRFSHFICMDMTALSALCSIRSSLWFLGEGNNVLLLLRKKSQALLSVAAVMANIPWEDDLHTPIYFFATTIQIILLPLFRNWSCETILWSKFDPMFWDKNVNMISVIHFCASNCTRIFVKPHEIITWC